MITESVRTLFISMTILEFVYHNQMETLYSSV